MLVLGVSSLDSLPGNGALSGASEGMPARRHKASADRLSDLVAELTRRRRGHGSHWLMVGDLHAALAWHGVEVSTDDLDAAIAVAVEWCVLKTAGAPVYSISPWQRSRPIGGEPVQKLYRLGVL